MAVELHPQYGEFDLPHSPNNAEVVEVPVAPEFEPTVESSFTTDVLTADTYVVTEAVTATSPIIETSEVSTDLGRGVAPHACDTTISAFQIQTNFIINHIKAHKK
ncbi:hypothetical protein KC980_01790 [candidate division WWE3 bacterium]|uniref:Uncharacterized protein n=1 Tax=candidate division WWE3 bacterium TaxID=2053526 RepID=A0A955EB36_UNCKA|nr:hypothetical protein [candidate division WWE3 bacterium]